MTITIERTLLFLIQSIILSVFVFPVTVSYTRNVLRLSEARDRGLAWFRKINRPCPCAHTVGTALVAVRRPDSRSQAFTAWRPAKGGATPFGFPLTAVLPDRFSSPQGETAPHVASLDGRVRVK
jgi:hypothetical protein